MIKKCKICNKDFEHDDKRQLTCSQVCGNKAKSIGKIGLKNPNWVGEKVGYTGIHTWIKRRKKKPEKCNQCGGPPSPTTGLDLANISQKYKRDLDDWEYLCRRCHMTKDGRKEKFIKRTKNRPNKRIKKCVLCSNEKSATYDKLCRSCAAKNRRKK